MPDLNGLRILLVALLVALLPVRGFAGMAMHLPVQPQSTVAPCHGDADPVESAQIGSGDAAGCALCDLCHGVMLTAPPLPVQPERGSQDVPQALRTVWPAVEPEALFRPPSR